VCLQHGDRPGVEVVVGADDAEVAAHDQGRERAVVGQEVHHAQDLGPDDLVDDAGEGGVARVAHGERGALIVGTGAGRLVEGGAHSRHERVEVPGQVGTRPDGLHGGGDRAAPLVAHDDDERGAVLQRAILDRRGDQVIDGLRPGADGEQVADPLVEDGLRRQPRVDARDDRGEGVLPRRHLRAACDVLVGVLKVA
jgi:hypothetical protein